MGVFDTLRIDIEGKPIELQSKRFGQTPLSWSGGARSQGFRLRLIVLDQLRPGEQPRPTAQWEINPSP